jgi:hypothetical protein
MKRFSTAETDRLKDMARRGYDGKTISLALGRPAEAIRSKAVALGVPLRPQSLDGRRIKLTRAAWVALATEGFRLNMKPSRLARLIIEMTLHDGLLDAVLAGLPSRLQKTSAR